MYQIKKIEGMPQGTTMYMVDARTFAAESTAAKNLMTRADSAFNQDGNEEEAKRLVLEAAKAEDRFQAARDTLRTV